MPKYYEFDVSLLGVKPKIFRRFALLASSTFADLHDAIQLSCGWEDDHLHVFRNSPRGEDFAAGAPVDNYDTGTDAKPDRRVKLYSYFSDGWAAKRCTYIYDFGDNWEHDVKLVRVFESDERFKRKLIDGARAFPPEDCGGIWGYEDSCELLENKSKSAENKARREWLGDWNPEAFDMKEIQAQFDRPMN
jgi:hypothetical protein